MNCPAPLRKADTALNSENVVTGAHRRNNYTLIRCGNLRTGVGACPSCVGDDSTITSTSSAPTTFASCTDKPSNFPQQESQHHYYYYHLQSRKECPAAVWRTFLWLLTCFLVTGGTFAAEPFISPWSCKYPDPVEFASVKPDSTPRGGLYFNGSKAHVDCYSNFRVKNGDPTLTCVDGEWKGVDGRTVECELLYSTGATTCGPYPKIDQGFYGPLPDDTMAQGNVKEEGHPVGSELQASCVSTHFVNCTHPHNEMCGRISCQSDGRWVPKDGQLVTACVAKSAGLTVNGDDERHGQKSSSLKNYLVLTLVLVCIFVVGALTVALLRRPLFCKKREQNQGDGPVVITSASPNHQQLGSDLDSLPVAMNTGIFMPGADYSLQDCQIQDVPFVGTTVFK